MLNFLKKKEKTPRYVTYSNRENTISDEVMAVNQLISMIDWRLINKKSFKKEQLYAALINVRDRLEDSLSSTDWISSDEILNLYWWQFWAVSIISPVAKGEVINDSRLIEIMLRHVYYEIKWLNFLPKY